MLSASPQKGIPSHRFTTRARESGARWCRLCLVLLGVISIPSALADDVLWAGRWVPASETHPVPKELAFLHAWIKKAFAHDQVEAVWKRGRITQQHARRFSWPEPDSFQWEIQPLEKQVSFYRCKVTLQVQGTLLFAAEVTLARDQPLFFLHQDAMYFLLVR